uniref:DUF834 domain-containing protein n=1 Tax=Oryza sativa subsp. japonica TaxID=39947 RepID=Q6YSW5_ORYSJ|nr:hypothetical protein [Oryza sativa Japonica Group]
MDSPATPTDFSPLHSLAPRSTPASPGTAVTSEPRYNDANGGHREREEIKATLTTTYATTNGEGDGRRPWVDDGDGFLATSSGNGGVDGLRLGARCHRRKRRGSATTGEAAKLRRRSKHGDGSAFTVTANSGGVWRKGTGGRGCTGSSGGCSVSFTRHGRSGRLEEEGESDRWARLGREKGGQVDFAGRRERAGPAG